MWTKSHGPVASQEPAAARAVLENWRQKSISSQDDTPIFIAVKNTQKVFNGYGAQETCDMLYMAILSPCMPAYLVCRNDVLWKRFSEAVVNYQRQRLDLVSGTDLPAISGKQVIFMNTKAHEKFIGTVSCYRKKQVKVHRDCLKLYHSLGLLDPDATIQDDGTAVGKSLFYLVSFRLFVHGAPSCSCQPVHL